MKKRMKRILGIILLIVFAFFYAHIAKVHNIYNKEIDPSAYSNTGVLTQLGVQQWWLPQERWKEKKLKTASFLSFPLIVWKTVKKYPLNFQYIPMYPLGKLPERDFPMSR